MKICPFSQGEVYDKHMFMEQWRQILHPQKLMNVIVEIFSTEYHRHATCT